MGCVHTRGGERRPWKRARTPNSIFLDLPIQVWHLSFTSFSPLLPLFPFSGHIAPDADGLIESVVANGQRDRQLYR